MTKDAAAPHPLTTPGIKGIIDRSTRAGEPGYSWEDLATAGHCFPQRCPEWSGVGIGAVRPSIMAQGIVPVVVVVCTCGVVSNVPAPGLVPFG